MKIINILADGSIKEDLTGYLVNPETAGDFYKVLKRISEVKKNGKKSIT